MRCLATGRWCARATWHRVSADAFAEQDTIVEPAQPEVADLAASLPEEEEVSSPSDSVRVEDAQPESPPDFELGAAPKDTTEDIGTAPVAPPIPAPSPPEVVSAPPGELSDADVDRIARRVVELAADRLEQIAWEVIPDMAEIVVRERLRELETEVERHADTPAN